MDKKTYNHILDFNSSLKKLQSLPPGNTFRVILSYPDSEEIYIIDAIILERDNDDKDEILIYQSNNTVSWFYISEFIDYFEFDIQNSILTNGYKEYISEPDFKPGDIVEYKLQTIDPKDDNRHIYFGNNIFGTINLSENKNNLRIFNDNINLYCKSDLCVPILKNIWNLYYSKSFKTGDIIKFKLPEFNYLHNFDRISSLNNEFVITEIFKNDTIEVSYIDKFEKVKSVKILVPNLFELV